MLLIVILANGVDIWTTLIANAPPALVLGFCLWWILSRTIPDMEVCHERQMLTQRADLLELVRKEKELAEKVIQIFASGQSLTVKDNHEAIIELNAKADILKEAAREVLEAFKSSTVVADEIVRVRNRLADLEKKYGSARRNPRPTKVDDDTPEPPTRV